MHNTFYGCPTVCKMSKMCFTIRSISPLYPYVTLSYSAQPQQTEETVEMKQISVAGGYNHLCSSYRQIHTVD